MPFEPYVGINYLAIIMSSEMYGYMAAVSAIIIIGVIGLVRRKSSKKEESEKCDEGNNEIDSSRSSIPSSRGSVNQTNINNNVQSSQLVNASVTEVKREGGDSKKKENGKTKQCKLSSRQDLCNMHWLHRIRQEYTDKEDDRSDRH